TRWDGSPYGNKYLVVNRWISDNQYAPSVSGRYDPNSDILAAFYNDDSNAPQDVYYKSENYFTTHFRKSNATDLQYSIYPNPFLDYINITLQDKDEIVLVSMYDFTGKVLMLFSGTEAEINKMLNGKAEKLSTGMYLMHIDSEAGEEIV